MTEHEIRVERYLHAIACFFADFMEQRFSGYSGRDTLNRYREKLDNTIEQLAEERFEDMTTGKVTEETKNKINSKYWKY